MWNDLVGFVQRCHARILTVDFKEAAGQGLVEYALIIALVSVALVTVLGELALGIKGVFTTIIGDL